MTVKELKEAFNNIPDDAEVLAFESNDWQYKAVGNSYCLEYEYLYTKNNTGGTLLLFKPV